MKIKIKRPFYLSTLFWKYKVEINDNVFIIKDTGDTLVELEDSPNIKIKVSYSNYFTSHLTIDDTSKCKEIEVRSSVSNKSVIFCLLIMVAILIISLYTGNNLYVYIGIVVYSLLGLIFFDLFRKNFFRIVCV